MTDLSVFVYSVWAVGHAVCHLRRDDTSMCKRWQVLRESKGILPDGY